MRKFLPALFCMMSGWVQAQTEQPLVIGTYTGSGSYGIYAAWFDSNSGQIRLADSVQAQNPSWLHRPAGKPTLYAVQELAGPDGGKLAAYAYEQPTGRLRLRNEVFTLGNHPCYVTTDKAGRYAVVANYSGGSISVFPVKDDGSLLPAVQHIVRAGSGPNAQRQEKAHVHQVVFAPKEAWLIATDLGTDEVIAYPYRPAKKLPLDTARARRIQLDPGTGPRHLVFHPHQSIFYVVGELNGKVSVHGFNKHNIALLQQIQADTISANPGSAAIRISPDARFLYVSNRADAHSISIFSIHPHDGRLQRAGTLMLPGKGPRDFTLDPTGKWLLVALQNSNRIEVYARNSNNGLPEPTARYLTLPGPVHLLFTQQ